MLSLEFVIISMIFHQISIRVTSWATHWYFDSQFRKYKKKLGFPGSKAKGMRPKRYQDARVVVGFFVSFCVTSVVNCIQGGQTCFLNAGFSLARPMLPCSFYFCSGKIFQFYLY